MNTAVRDGAIVKNLCQTAGAGTAGKRTVTIPPYVLPVLVDRMASWPVRIGCSSGVMAG